MIFTVFASYYLSVSGVSPNSTQKCPIRDTDPVGPHFLPKITKNPQATAPGTKIPPAQTDDSQRNAEATISETLKRRRRNSEHQLHDREEQIEGTLWRRRRTSEHQLHDWEEQIEGTREKPQRIDIQGCLSRLQYPDATKSSAKDLSRAHDMLRWAGVIFSDWYQPVKPG